MLSSTLKLALMMIAACAVTGFNAAAQSPANDCKQRLGALSHDMSVLHSSLDGNAEPPISLDFPSQVIYLNTLVNHLGNSIDCLAQDENDTIRSVADTLNQFVDNGGTSLLDVSDNEQVGRWFSTLRGQLNSIDNSDKSNNTRGRKIWGFTYLKTIVAPSITATENDLTEAGINLSDFAVLHAQYLDIAFTQMQHFVSTQNETGQEELRSGFGIENFLKSQNLVYPF